MKEGDETVYGYTLTDCHMRKAWKKLLEESQYYQRMETIKEFNRYLMKFMRTFNHFLMITVKMSG